MLGKGSGWEPSWETLIPENGGGGVDQSGRRGGSEAQLHSDLSILIVEVFRIC